MIYRLPFLLLILIFLSSCARPHEKFAVQGEFEGIKTALQRQNCVNIVTIHGMGGYSPGDPETLKNAIVQSLRLSKSCADCVREIVGQVSDKPYYYGYLKREEYHDPCNAKAVRFYTVFWHPTVGPQKRRLLAMDKNMSACREKTIEELKHTLIDNTTADTFLYFSTFRSEIEFPIKQSIRWIVEDSASLPSVENLVVGYSMGGTLFINSLSSMLSNQQNEIAKTFINETSAVYFLSNGYPLAELVEDHPEKSYDYDDKQACEQTASTANTHNDIWNWEKSPIGQFVYEKRKSLPPFKIISFYDPNDIFGFNATMYPVPSLNDNQNAFLNIRVKNVSPTPFGFLDTREAHTGYGKNPRVINLIINGLRSTRCAR